MGGDMQLTAWVIESRNVCRQLEGHSTEGTVSHDILSILSGARFLSLARRKGKTGTLPQQLKPMVQEHLDLGRLDRPNVSQNPLGS